MKRLLSICMLPIGILIFLIGSYQPEIVEKIYSNGIFKILAQSISHVTSLVPFSIAEFVVFFSLFGFSM